MPERDPVMLLFNFSIICFTYACLSRELVPRMTGISDFTSGLALSLALVLVAAELSQLRSCLSRVSRVANSTQLSWKESTTGVDRS